ncbi:MAG TPA: amidohydrolase family protein [Acidimicrobiia bacterium]|jgi:cytosine/adenosine deaminase-related metal-dependent hydrolase/ribose/xylose/arabinose/galactoside ABC-type transport system permease subunit|nr:amidohydrolase family protein [Acidimicrobiia bacterium]
MTGPNANRADRGRQLARKVLRNARDKNKWRKVVKFRLWMPVALQLLLLAGLLWYTNTRFPGFVNASNITNILLLAMPLAVVTIAQTHALLVGYLDLSVGSMISLGVVIASYLIGVDAGAGQILVGTAVILGTGLVLGLVNAALVRGVKIPSIIATLATLSILDGISLSLRPTAQGTISADLVSLLTTKVGPIPIAFIVIVLGAGALDVWLHASGSGLEVRAVGFDERSAKRGGIRTNWVRVRALVIASVLAAAASFLVMARSPVGNASIGSTFALNSITAAVLGGASLAGGRATFMGSTVASVLLALIITVLPFLGLTPSDGSMIIGVLVLAGIVLFQVGDLKELVKRNFRRARRIVLGSRVGESVHLPDFYPGATDLRVVSNERKLIQGGLVLSLDPSIGDVVSGDVLVEGDEIVAVGPGLSASDAEVIDATGMIVMPGFIDTHRHIWEGLLRNIGTDVPLEGRTSYISFVLHKLAPAFRPEDAYVGNLVSALGAIDAGITTLLDWSHIQGSPAHTDAVIQALRDSGMRAVFAYGFPWWGKWEERQPSWFVRAATEHFSSKDQTLTLALAAPGPEFTDFEVSRDHWKLARETGARISTHVGVGTYGLDAKVQEMGEAGLLGPDTTYIHCTTLNDTEIQMIVDTGGTVSLASPVEMMMGHGMPPIQKFLDRGLRPSLSVDVETNVPGDMFNQMRSVLTLQRTQASSQGKPGLSPREVVMCATIDGARANGLDHKVGTLTPGKQADLIMLRTDRMNVTPLNDPLTAIVAGMDTGNVDTVIIAGRVMKRGGKLLHVDWESVHRTAEQSRDHVIAKSGFKLPKI